MSSKTAVLFVAGGSLLLPAPGIAGAQQGPLFQAQSVVAWGRGWFAGAGLGIGLGFSPRTTAALSASFGTQASRAAARAEVLASFYLSPPGFAKVDPYLAGGAAFLWSAALPQGEYLVLVLGLEKQLSTKLRGFAEAGLGGGARAAAGVRAAL